MIICHQKYIKQINSQFFCIALGPGYAIIKLFYSRKITMNWYGGIEAGGTKFYCIIASDPQHILAEATIPTTTPQKTLPEVVSFFVNQQAKLHIHLNGMGVSCFGPINLDPQDAGYGTITSTPKVQWQNTSLLKLLKAKLDLPFGFDTDVNGAALGEGLWGAGQGLSDFIYITVGTGIGGGIITNHQPVHGLIHPEVGHMRINHDWAKDPYAGNCPFHGDCLEGLACGPAMTSRWGISTHDLNADHPAWELEANYLSQAIHNLALTLSPKRFILGGGVMNKSGLIEKVRAFSQDSLNGYIDHDTIKNMVENFIVPPALGNRSGALGAIALAISAASDES
jgi:fructokinase